MLHIYGHVFDSCVYSVENWTTLLKISIQFYGFYMCSIRFLIRSVLIFFLWTHFSGSLVVSLRDGCRLPGSFAVAKNSISEYIVLNLFVVLFASCEIFEDSALFFL